MPAFNFQAQFAPLILSGAKRQTIRARRKHRPKAGYTAYCYTGLRTRACRKFGEWTITEVACVTINQQGVWFDGSVVAHDLLDLFAQADGFADWPAMRDWFATTHGLPFNGDLIRWRYT